MVQFLVFLAAVGLLLSLILRSDSTQATQPVSPAPTDWFHRALLFVTNLWGNHGQVWRRWFIGTIAFLCGYLFSAALSFLTR